MSKTKTVVVVTLSVIIMEIMIGWGMTSGHAVQSSALPEHVGKFVDPANGVTCYYYGEGISCIAPEIDRD